MAKPIVGLVLVVLMLQAHQTMPQEYETIEAILQVFKENGLSFSFKVYDVSKDIELDDLVSRGIGAHSTRNAEWKLGDLKLLEPQTGSARNPPEWNVFILRNGIWTVAILTRSDNMFLCGYWTHLTGWKEIGNDDLIPGSTRLGFNGTYAGLNGQRLNLTAVELSRETLGDAVRYLATNTEELLVKRQLTVIVLMLCETQRFTAIRDCVLTGWDAGCYITMRDVIFLTEWGELSCALIEDWDPAESYRRLEALMVAHHVARVDVPGMLVVLLRPRKCVLSMEHIELVNPPEDP